jgi:hypothetical protein
MAFYLRKSLSFGPVRFNLSKGGVGVSAGVTGARIGLNKNGAYVHGGRHGLYYREKLGKKRRSGKSSGQGEQSTDTVEMFVDTGVTYSGGQSETEEQKAEQPTHQSEVADLKSLAYPFYFAGLGAVIAGITAENAAVIIAAGVIIAALGPLYRKNKRAAARKTLEEISEALEQAGEAEHPLDVLKELHQRPLPKAFHPKRDELIAEAALLLYMDSHPRFDEQALKEMLSLADISDAYLKFLKKEIFEELMDDFVADHIISEEEENRLEEVIRVFDLKDDDIKAQRRLIRQLVRLREEMASGFEEVECPLKLTRNEACYYATEGKLLKQRVLDSFQRDGVRYKQIGYETDKDGMIYLSNKQIYISDSGVRSIRLNTILDITCSLEDNTLHLSLSNRVNPIILSVPETTVFAARLNYFTEQA